MNLTKLEVTPRRNDLFSKIFRQITYLYLISMVKVLLSRKFCQSRVRVNFLGRFIITSVENVDVAKIICFTANEHGDDDDDG